MANHISAIHVLKSKIGLSEDEYRGLLFQLTGKMSSKDLNARELLQVRDHMDKLGVRMGVVQPVTRNRPMTREEFEAARAKASPMERKVWALWHELGRKGLIGNTSAKSLNAWVHRIVGVSAVGFATEAQLRTLVESLKEWSARGEENV